MPVYIQNRDQSASVISVQVQDVGAVGSKKENKDKLEIARLRTGNDLYQRFQPLWDFYLSSYEGGDKFAKPENLFKHPREHPDDFNQRATRIYYHNYVEPLVDFFTTFIYQETIQRDGGADESDKAYFTNFIRDVNRKGDDVTAFMKQVSDDMQIFGMSFVLVDAPPKSADIQTVAQEQEAGIAPYWVIIRPDEVLDWVVDEFDNFMYFRRRQYVRTVNPSTFKTTKLERYTEWTNQSIRITDIDITEDKEPKIVNRQDLPNELGSIPVVTVRYRRSKSDSFVGHSFLTDIAFIAREVMNLTSLLQEFLYRQCFNILAMEEDPNVPEIEQLQGEISTANMLRYPKDSKAPSYITPPVDPAKFLQTERDNNVQSMYRIAAEDTANDLFNGAKRSGYSQSQSFKSTVPRIATRADALEAGEMKLFALTFKRVGRTFKGAIKYKDHYEITNLTDMLTQLGTLFKDLQVKSKTFAAAEMKRLVHEFDGKLTPEQIVLVEKEIDAIQWERWFGIQEMAYMGAAARSTEAAGLVDDTKPVAGGAPGGAQPVKGKDTSTAPSTASRAQSSSTEIQQEARAS